MTIETINAIRLANGVTIPSETVLRLSAELEADFVTRGDAAYRNVEPVVDPRAQRPLGNRAIVFGDSLALQEGGPGTASSAFWNENGVLNHARRNYGQRLDIVRNAGIGGNTTAMMLARLSTDVLAYPSDGVVMIAPTNDYQNGIRTHVTQRNLSRIAEILRDAGRWLGFIIAPPRSWTLPGDAALLRRQRAGNEWLRQWACSEPGVHLLGDAYTSLIDPLSATGAYRTDMSNETVAPFIHWNNLGAFTFSGDVGPRLQALFPAVQYLPTSVLDINANLPWKIADDPLFQATPAAVASPAGASGNLPTGVTCTAFTTGGTVSFAIVASARGYGNDIEATIAASGAGVLTVESNIATGAARLNGFNAYPYQIVAGGFSRVVSQSATVVQRSRWRFIAGGSPPIAQIDPMTANSNSKALPIAGLDCIDVTPRYLITAGQSFPSSVRMQYHLEINGAANIVVRFGGPFLDVIQPTRFV